MRKIISCLGLSLFAAFHFAYSQCESFREDVINPAYALRYDSPDESLRIINEGIKEIADFDSKICQEHLATAYLVRGMALRTKSLYAEAQSAMEKAQTLREELGDKVGVAKVLNALSSNAKGEGNFPKAFDYSNQALTRLNKLALQENPKTIGNAYIAAINILIELDFYTLPELEKYITAAKDAYRKMNGDFSREIVIANYNLGVGYNRKGIWQKAHELFLECHTFFSTKKDTFSIAMIENELGVVQQARGRLQEARNHYQRSIELFTEVDSQDGTILPSLGLAEVLLQEGTPEQALMLIENIQLDTTESIANRVRLERIYIGAHKVLKQIEPMASHLLAIDSLNQNIEKDNNQQYFLVKEKDKLKELLDVSIYQNKRNFIIGVILGICLITIFLIVLIIEKSRTSQQKTYTENQKEETKFQEKIAKILKGHGHNFSIDRNKLNRKLHDVICPKIISVKREMEYYIMTKKEDGLVEAMELADSLYEDTRALIRNEDNLDLQTDWLQNILLIINQQKRMGQLEINEHFDLNPNEISPSIGNQIAVIANVLLENIEKWAEAEQASISIIRENGSVMMVVDDDGIGFSSDEVVVRDNRHSSGIGLKNVKYRIEEELGGKLKIDSRKGEGTTINISIPLNNTK